MRNRSERWYRVLLGFLPGSLRAGFEEEMARDFLLRLGGARGLTGKAHVWAGAVLDLLVQGVSERFRVRRGRARKRTVGGCRSSLDSLGKDVAHAARTLRRSPSFTLVAALTLALGIGGTTVAFSLVRGVLVRPLPFPDDQELVVLRQLDPEQEEQNLSFPNFDDLRNESRSLGGIAALRFPHGTTILGGAEPASGVVVPVSREFFSLLGVPPFLGRPILPEENRPGGEPVAVVGFDYWSRFLGSEERLDGLRIVVEGRSYAVVGVMPPGFKVLEEADVYLPMERTAQRIRGSSNYRGVGRLAKGATLEETRTELNGIARRLEEAYPGEARLSGIALRPLREELLGAVTRPLLLLLGASGILLLLACSNVGSTLMARSIGREREMAIRAALGGGKGRLVRMVLAESLLLGTLSGMAGVGLTLAALGILKSAGAGLIPRLATVRVDGMVLGWALAATLLTSLLFGVLPALHLPRTANGLRSGSGGNTRRRGWRAWTLLIQGQVALTVALLVASGLLLRSMREILSSDMNFRSEGVLTVALDFTSAGFTTLSEGQAEISRLKDEWQGLPGVTEVGFVSYLPTTHTMMTGTVYRPPLPEEGMPEHMAGSVGWRVVDADYFRAMGIPLVRGRFFQAQDGAGSQPVIILNEPLERALFPEGGAVGSFVGFYPFWRNTELEVVGVVAEARDWRVAAGEQMEGFILMAQRPSYADYLTAVLHTDGDPSQLVAGARERLRVILPDVPGTFRTLDSILADSFRDRTFTLAVLGVFALLSVFLSAVGLYGVVSYTVSAQAREIGIMLALGAERGAVRARYFLRSLGRVGAGVVGGIGLALLAGGVLESLLFQVDPRDPVALILAPLVLLFSASCAVLLPVVRHTRIDPAESMRAE